MYPTVTCPICSREFQKITNAHLKSHNLDFWKFRELFPSSPIESPEMRAKYRVSENTQQKSKLTKQQQKTDRVAAYDKQPTKCKQCGVPLVYDCRHNEFCSHTCAASNSNQTRILSLEAKSNISEAAKQNAWRLQSYTEARKEKQPPYSKIYQKVCATCGLNFSSRWKTTLTCSPECKSIRHAIYNHKQNKTFGKCGYLAGLWCASTWELAFVIYSMDQGLIVSRCPDHFEYEYNGKIKRYFPDFTIDGIIYEIKGQMTDDVPLKTNAVIDAGRLICVLTKSDITPMLKYVKTKYSVTDLATLYQTT